MWDFLGTNIGTFMEILTGIVGLFALIATLTPNQADNVIADKALKGINLLAANFGRSRNE